MENVASEKINDRIEGPLMGIIEKDENIGNNVLLMASIEDVGEERVSRKVSRTKKRIIETKTDYG